MHMYFLGMEDSLRRAQVPSYHVVWAWAVSGVGMDERAVESGQWSVVSWWGKIHETRYWSVGVVLADAAAAASAGAPPAPKS